LTVNTLAVLNQDVHIEECVYYFVEMGLLALNPLIPSAGDIDFIEVADRLIEQLKLHGRAEENEYILKKLKQILNYRDH